jgi:mannose-6-phosphate isomerase-like protein (cupin superfamily)
VADAIEIEPVSGWKGRVRHGQHMTLTSHDVAEDAPDVHEHQRPEEEAWTVIEGRLIICVDSREQVLGPGDSVIVAANARHCMRALQPSRALVVDSPGATPVAGHRALIARSRW